MSLCKFLFEYETIEAETGLLYPQDGKLPSRCPTVTHILHLGSVTLAYEIVKCLFLITVLKVGD